MVKQLQPNELGFYDMSGNVWEFSSTLLSGYSSYHMYYGGGYSSNESSCTITASNNTDDTSYSSSVGLRFALKP
jgi:formylglycine-generating enzyme required for sulfatase activity